MGANNEVEFIAIRFGPMPDRPEWLRSFGVTQDGQLLLPAGGFGPEGLALGVASYDGRLVVQHLNHLFMEPSLLCEAFPEVAEDIRYAESFVRAMPEFKDASRGG